MIQLLQIINHMLNLGYSQDEIADHFQNVVDQNETLDDLMYGIGVELTESQYDMLAQKLHRVDSALSVVQMKRGA